MFKLIRKPRSLSNQKIVSFNKVYFKFFLSFLFFFSSSLISLAQVCGTSGLDGPQNSVSSVNTYFPLSTSTNLAAGSKSIILNAVPPNDPNYNLSYGVTPIKSGDLILIIQIQDASFDYSNSNLYGSGLTNSGPDNLGGTGYTSLNNSGKFEYVVATSGVPITGGTLTFRGAGIGKGCVYTYTNTDVTTTAGQKRFQVVRVPQYSNLVLTANITTPPYNGSVGGLIAFDVAGTMQFNGFIVDASERGFRGGYGDKSQTSGSNNATDYVLLSSSSKSVGKGEGIAGTPKYMWDGFNRVINPTDGLPSGSYGRGAPANGGGGGNDHNSGGGGGANGGYGGLGGAGWQGANGDLFSSGLTGVGRPGTLLPIDYSRLIMGGGGGGGDANNAVTDVKGGVGGGIIIINVEKIDGIGVIQSNGGNGEAGAYGSAPDGAGGGGAGGSIFVRSLAASPTANLKLEVKGGNGGNTKNDTGSITPHGPGGGGGGGVIYIQVPSATINSVITKGSSGKTNNGAGITHGAIDGTDGRANSFITSDLPSHLHGGGSICYPELTTTLNELHPGPAGARTAGVTATYTLTIANSPTNGNAGNVEAWFKLPSSFKVSSISYTLTGDAAGTLNAAPYIGASGLMNFGNFNISPGDKVIIIIEVNIATNAPKGIYHASAQATYLDPTRTIACEGRKITAFANAFNGTNTTYETGMGGNVDGVNYNGDLVTSIAEDVYINAAAITDSCDAITGGGFETYSEGDYPSLDKWSIVNSGDLIKVANQDGLNGSVIKNNAAEKFSLQQTVISIEPSNSYTFNFNYRNLAACGSLSTSKFYLEILDANTNAVIFTQTEFVAGNSPAVGSILFTTLAGTTSLILKITAGLPNSDCGTFIDHISIISNLNIIYPVTNVTCNGANNGEVNIKLLVGAAAPYQISYSLNGENFSTPVPINPINKLGIPLVFSRLLPGSYRLKIDDANGCENIKNFSITEPTALSLTESHTNVLCNGGTTSLILTAIGGTGVYQYSNDGITFQNSEIFNNLIGGSYTFYVKDANSCTTTINATIIQPRALSLAEFHTNVLCNGGTTSLTLTATGGRGTYQYSIDGTAFQSSEIFNNLIGGSYTFYVKDANSCTTTVSVTITQPSALSLAESHTNLLCNGGTASSLTLTATGGTGAYQYSNDGTAFQSSATFTSLTAGSYTFYVKDANSCTTTVSATIIQPTALSLAESHIEISCNSGTTSLTLTATGGTGVYQYSIDGTTFESLATFTSLTAGSYTFYVKDANSCTTIVSATITQPTALSLVETHTNVLCYGAASGRINVNVTGGTAPYTYRWNSGQKIEDLNSFVAGNYQIIVTDANGCTIGKLIQITQPLAPLTISETHQNILCFGDASGSIDITTNGGIAPYTYLWNNGSTIQDPKNLSDGIYTVTMTDASGCQMQKSIIITQPKAPLTLIEAHVNNVCYGNQIGKIDITVSGGKAPYTYLWNNGKQTQDLSELSGGNYQLKVTDANGCIGQISITITPLQSFQIKDIVNQVKCSGAGNGSIQLQLIGGEAPYAVLWSNGQTGTQINNLIPGTYSYTAKDVYGCILQETFTITEPKSLSGTLNITNTTCKFSKDGKVLPLITGGISPYQYFWNGKATSGNGFIKFLTAGKYTLNVLDANGCSFSLIADVLPGNCAPNADNDYYRTMENTPITITSGVVVNDSDPDDDQIKVELSSVNTPNGSNWNTTEIITSFNTLNGKVVINKEGSFTYMPNPNFYGVDEFMYQVSDGSEKSNFATVIINVVSAVSSSIGPGENLDISPDPLVSPNGDGQGNETFKVYNIESFSINEVVIFNRWGNEVYRMKDYDNSGNSFKGVANVGILTNSNVNLVDGVYYYLIYTELNSQKKLNKGYLILRR